VSHLADSGNGEVEDATTDLPFVNGQEDPISNSKAIPMTSTWILQFLGVAYTLNAFAQQNVASGSTI
jgi:hypothetical protein